jgi:flavodoxin
VDFSAAHRDVLVLVGTQTGNSELVAAAVSDRLAGLGFTCHVVDMADAYPEMLADYAQLVAVTCTWADGTFPDNAKDFAAALDGLPLDLSGLAFGVVGLGDHDYDPYYLTAAERLDEMLTERGAHRLVPMLGIDGIPAASDYEAARAWTLALAEAFAAQTAG